MSDAVDGNTRRRLALGLISNAVSKLGSSITQLVQVPVFLHFWSVPLYGEWMIVNSIPAYLSFSDIGFGTVAGNEMTMSTAVGDRDRALRIFQSCWWLIICLCSLVGVAFTTALYFFPFADTFKLHAISSNDAKWIIFYLGCSVLLGQLEQLLQSAYTCVGRYPYGSFLKSSISLSAFALMMIPVALHRGPRDTALVFALANMAGTIFLCWAVRRDIPWIEYGWRHARFSEIRRMASPAIAYMGFPLGNALNLQGTLLVVGYALGPTDVVVFGTARTVSRVALQLVQMVNSTFMPELSSAYGAGNVALIRALHRRAYQLALVTAILVIACMMTFGPWFLNHWTGGRVAPNRGLLSILLLVVVFYACWSTSSTLIAAINRHQKLAAFYLLGTGVSIAFTFILAKQCGLYGAAASLLICDLIMNLYVLPTSLRLCHDTFPAFFASLFSYPSSLHPRELLKRLR
jgi:O-antigen/teichoic acid export membrane protein